MTAINFRLNWKLTLFVLIFLPLTMRLGFWQLDRAEQKRQTIDEFETLIASEPVNLNYAANADLADYQPIRVSGRLLPEAFLLDNQVYAGQVGYEVVQPLVFDLASPMQDATKATAAVFVSRGFIAATQSRDILPEIKTPAFNVQIDGYAYQPRRNSLLEDYRDEQLLQRGGKQVVQQLDVENLYTLWANNDKISHPFLAPALSNMVIRLDRQSPFLFASHWQLVNNTPEKHIGYAIQWFLLAILLAVLFIWASVVREN